MLTRKTSEDYELVRITRYMMRVNESVRDFDPLKMTPTERYLYHLARSWRRGDEEPPCRDCYRYDEKCESCKDRLYGWVDEDD